jgi:UDPglucose--hexose-1-phosphate uridylyltransferase
MDGPLPSLRTDRLLGRSVLVAENRAQRPNEFGEGFSSLSGQAGRSVASHSPGVSVCPFCRGQEHRTPSAVFELTDEYGHWQTRVVPNMFPAVVLAGDIREQVDQLPDVGGATSSAAVAAIGVQEVVIESPQHVDRMSALSERELRRVLETYIQRLNAWRSSGRFGYGLIFKNQGARAGASLSHLHSQLIALSSVPPAVAGELERAGQDFRQHRSCPFCRIIETERATGRRIIQDASGFIAFCPFASVQPFEAWLMPAEHSTFFEDLQPDSLDRLAPFLFELLRRIKRLCRNRPITCCYAPGPGWAAAANGAIGGSRFCPASAHLPALSWPAACLSIPSRQNAPPANSVRSSFFWCRNLNFDDPVN